MAKQAAEGLRALAVHLEKDSSLTTAAADRMALDFFQSRQAFNDRSTSSFVGVRQGTRLPSTRVIVASHVVSVIFVIGDSWDWILC